MTTSTTPAGVTEGVGSPKKPKDNGAGTPLRTLNSTSRAEGCSEMTTELDFVPKKTEKVLYINSFPLVAFESIAEEFEEFGSIKKICVKLTQDYLRYNVWIVYDTHSEALMAYSVSVKSKNLNCSLIEEISVSLRSLLTFYPSIQDEVSKAPEVDRTQMPATWLIVKVKKQLSNLFIFRKFMRHKAGGIAKSNITRFGQNAFLIHARNPEQSVMITLMKNQFREEIESVKPHYNFSYAKGVVFDKDMNELPQEELLEICPPNIWKVFQVPNSQMIIFTFQNDMRPESVYIDGENYWIHPFKYRPLQCFNCFGYGHASKVCERARVCPSCSVPKEETHFCSPPPVCINCKGEHDARNRNCQVYKKEQEAVNKANDEFISVGQAKKLLSRTQRYNDVVRSGGSNASTRNVNHANNSNTNVAQSVRPKERNLSRQNESSNALPKNKGNGLSASQLEISVASEPSSKEASNPQSKGESRASSEVRQASREASQAPTVEGASQSSLPDLGEGLIEVDVHLPISNKMESSRKRSWELSSSPPSNSKTPVFTSNKFSALASVGDQDCKLDHPSKKHTSALKVESRDQRGTSSKPSLLRPPGAGKSHSERPAKTQKSSKYR